MTPEKPIVLFSGYEDSPRAKGKPDVFSRLQVVAATEMLREGQAEKVVFTTGAVEPGLPAISEDMAAHLTSIAPKRTEDVILRPAIATTRDEIAGLKRVADEHGWTNLMVVTRDAHRKRVERNVQRIFGKDHTVTIKPVEEVLGSFDRTITQTDGSQSPRFIDKLYKQILEKIAVSDEEKGFRRREKIINAIDQIPGIGGHLLDIMNTILRNKKLELAVARFLGKH